MKGVLPVQPAVGRAIALRRSPIARLAGPIRVALFAPSMTWGGAEKMFRRLAIGLADSGLEVDLVLASASGPNLESMPAIVRVIDLKCRRTLSSTRPLAQYIDRARPDVLISTLHYANLVAIWARALAAHSPQLIIREATTMSALASNSRQARNHLIVALARRFYPRADAIVANSLGAAQDLIDHVRVPPSMVRVIYNPACDAEIDSLAQEPVTHPWFVDEGYPLILSVGRLSVPKKYDLLIQAAAAARRQRPLRLVILGDGEERASLEALVRDLQAESFVSLPGFVSNPYAYMARADLFVLSSAWEGLPNALIEAMACGLPVVSTDCEHGPREILSVSACGCGPVGTMTPPNDVKGLAQAILDELAVDRDPEVLKRQATRFCTDRAVRAYKDLIHLGRRG